MLDNSERDNRCPTLWETLSLLEPQILTCSRHTLHEIPTDHVQAVCIDPNNWMVCILEIQQSMNRHHDRAKQGKKA